MISAWSKYNFSVPIAERSGGRQYSGVVRQQRIGGGLLLGAKKSLEAHREQLAIAVLIANPRIDVQITKCPHGKPMSVAVARALER